LIGSVLAGSAAMAAKSLNRASATTAVILVDVFIFSSVAGRFTDLRPAGVYRSTSINMRFGASDGALQTQVWQ
jgi:hypothetical protein